MKNELIKVVRRSATYEMNVWRLYVAIFDVNLYFSTTHSENTRKIITNVAFGKRSDILRP